MTFFVRHAKRISSLFLLGMIVLFGADVSEADPASGRKSPGATVVVLHCSYPPVSFLDASTNTPSGFFVDLMDLIAGRAGLQVSYVCESGWPEMMSAIESGKADLGALMKSAEREKRLLFTAPIEMTYLSFFARSQSSVDAENMPEGLRVGAIKGSMSYEQLKDRPGIRLRTEGSYEEGLFSLLAGEIDLFAGEESMVLKNAREARLEDRFKKVGKPFVERERGIAMRKDDARLLEQLNKVLPGIIGSPEYQRVYLKWYGTPEPFWTTEKILTASGFLLFIVVSCMAFWRYRSISKLNRRLARSIFERERAHAVLWESEARLRHITDNMVDMVGQFDQQAVFQYASPSYERVLGYRPEDLVGRAAIEMIHPDDRDQVVRAIDAMLKAGTGSAQFRYRHKDGGYRWIESTGRNVTNDRGEVVGSILGSRDITERKRAEEALRRSEQTMRSVLDSVDEGFIVIDRDYRILTANRAYCEQVNLPFGDVIGKKCHAVSHKSPQPCHEAGEDCAVKKAFETAETAAAYHKHADAEGTPLYVETKAFPLKNESGDVISVIEAINNITERHLLEQERLKTQKLEAIGTLAGGIAHDFNNLLQGVFSYISLARLKRDDREKSLAALEEAEKALHMSVKLTNQLLTFSKGGKPVMRPTDLRPVIENAAKFALSGSRSTYRISADGLWQAEADEGQIGQVIQNIVLNADQSMPEGGQVEITATNVQAPHPDLPQVLQKGKYIRITVKDSGIGIPEQYLHRIFDPYFTTKEKGSGLGLATSYSIIRNHNGLIDVQSETGKGTTFFVYLPAVAAPREGLLHPVAAAAAERKGRVLVMDDDQVIRTVAVELIKALGHSVEAAAHGSEVLELFQAAKRAGNPYDVLILDLTIRGGMGGAETTNKLLELDPAVKVVVSSGYSDDAIAADQKGLGYKAFLKKPYDVDALRAVLSSLLNL